MTARYPRGRVAVRFVCFRRTFRWKRHRPSPQITELGLGIAGQETQFAGARPAGVGLHEQLIDVQFKQFHPAEQAEGVLSAVIKAGDGGATLAGHVLRRKRRRCPSAAVVNRPMCVWRPSGRPMPIWIAVVWPGLSRSRIRRSASPHLAGRGRCSGQNLAFQDQALAEIELSHRGKQCRSRRVCLHRGARCSSSPAPAVRP